jgi:hypothetical protein
MTNKNNKEIIVNDQKFNSIASAADAFGMPHNTVRYRLSKGWTPEQALGLEPRPSHAGTTAGIPVEVQGLEFSSIRQAAKHFGRSYTHIFARLNEGCTIEQALGLIKRNDSLESKYPELAKQWHPFKNIPLTADTMAPHSGEKVWWLCQKGHEWEAVINSRTRGHGCPSCAGQKPTKRRNFATEFPDLLKEWDWEKNQNCRPENYTPRSTKKVWWKCEKGHSWQATITNRTRKWKSTCPCCANRILCDDNSLAQLRPDIAQDWHPNKNAPLTPNDVIAGGSKKVWWMCKHGHEWKTTIGLRVISGTGCPKCSQQTSRIEIAIYSELSSLFDDVVWREKIDGYECDIYLKNSNIGIEIDGIYWHSGKQEPDLAKSAAFEEKGIQLFRLREDDLPLLGERDISYKSTENKFLVMSRLVNSLIEHAKLTDDQATNLRTYTKGPGLINKKKYLKILANLPAPPQGESLADKCPDLAKEWAHDLNAPLLPEHFWPSANKKVWWRCENGHTWRTTINIRESQGTSCPKCPRPFIKVTDGRNLAAFNPELVREWHPEKNGDLHPEDFRPQSNKKVWWICNKGHEWQAQVTSRAKGAGCPYCYGRYASEDNNFAKKHHELLKEWDHQKNKCLKPSDFTPRNTKKIWWRCAMGHRWQASIYSRTKLKSACPDCFRAKRPKLRKYTIADMCAIAESRGGKCLSHEYKTIDAKLRWQCERGHEWEATSHNVLHNNSWCPVCARKS